MKFVVGLAAGAALVAAVIIKDDLALLLKRLVAQPGSLKALELCMRSASLGDNLIANDSLRDACALQHAQPLDVEWGTAYLRRDADLGGVIANIQPHIAAPDLIVTEVGIKLSVTGQTSDDVTAYTGTGYGWATHGSDAAISVPLHEVEGAESLFRGARPIWCEDETSTNCFSWNFDAISGLRIN